MSQKYVQRFHVTEYAIDEIVGRELMNWCLTTSAEDDNISIIRLLISSVNIVKCVYAHFGSAQQKRENIINDPKTILDD